MNELMQVVYLLAIIQIASDAGKGIKRRDLISLVGTPDAMKAIARGYRAKDEGLKRLLGYLGRHPVEGVTFHVNSDDIGFGNCAVVYFNLQWKGNRYQVSFHVPFDWDIKSMEDVSRTHWIRSTSTGAIRKHVPDSAETLVLLLKDMQEAGFIRR